MSGIAASITLDRGRWRLRAEFSAPASGCTAIFGPSGSGKTTLLRSIAGLEPEARGRVEILGEVWQDGTRNVPVHRRPLGMVFQNAALFPHLSVRGNLLFGWRRAPAAADGLAVDEVAERLGLSRLMEQMPATLSGGQRQRAAIARALLGAPRILLMDEPLASLDQAARGEILEVLETVLAEWAIPILYVSHSVEEVARLASTVVLLSDGEVKSQGPPETVFSDLHLPPAHSREACVVISAKVGAHDDEDMLTRLDFAGGSLWIHRVAAGTGSAQGARIFARDVSLALAPPADSTVLNVIPAVIGEMEEEGPSHMLVKLMAGETAILSRITRRSARLLELVAGKPVYALVKSVALD